MNGQLTGPTSVAGSWVATGAIDDTGTSVETVRFAGDTIHGVKTLSGARGTLTLEVQAVLVATSPTTLTFQAGHWKVVAGTGAYADVRGGGSPAIDPGTADLATGTVSVTHRGFVQVD